MKHSPTVYFTTPGELDLRSLTIMGLSAKEGENPIGEFGTGFKYAIATLLRTGHEITIRQFYAGGEETLSVFEPIPAEFRGKTFKAIRMTTGSALNFQPGRELTLPFTIDLGPKWEPWMAYRELACNTLDEKGWISSQDPETPALPATVIAVTGHGIWASYLSRSSIILDSIPIAASPAVEVHPGTSHYIYYRNVRVASFETPLRYTFNLTKEAGLSLTEDRTIANLYSLCTTLGYGLLTHLDTDDYSLLHYISTLPEQKNTSVERLIFEQCMNYSSSISPALSSFISNLTDKSHLHPKLLTIWRRMNNLSIFPEAITPTPYQRILTRKAFSILAALNISFFPFTIAKLDPNVLGACIEGHIYVSPDVFDLGERMLASTLYEEYAHQTLGFLDCSREFQNHLLNKLFAFVAREAEATAEAVANFEMDP